MDDIISIIMPVYNGEENIQISLVSLAEQTYKNFEVIIIDDGSDDNTAKVIENYTSYDSRYRYFYQNNKGVSGARNRGLEFANGYYICFLDAGDYYDHQFLEKMLLSIKKSNSEVCYCGYNIVTPKRIIKRRSCFKKGDILIDYILEKTNVHTTGWMLKKDLLDKYKIKFLERVSWGEDFEYFCEVLARSNKVTNVREYLSYYLKNCSNTQLSHFAIEKLDQDYNSIMRLEKNTIVNRSLTVKKALTDYRLSALLTYRLLDAIRRGEDKKIVLKYYYKYFPYYKKLTWSNGLKSIKLNISKVMLSVKLKNYYNVLI